MTEISITFSDLIAIPTLFLTVLNGAYFAIFHHTKIARLLSALFFLLSGFLLLSLNSTFAYPTSIYFILSRMAILIPGVLWLLTYYLFTDSGSASWRIWLLLYSYIGLQSMGVAISLWFDGFLNNSLLMYFFLILVPQICMMGLALHALYLAIRGYYSDLIEVRRTARVAFIISISLLVIIVLGNGVVDMLPVRSFDMLQSGRELVPESLIAIYLMVLTTSFHFFTFTMRTDIYSLVQQPKPDELPLPAKDSKVGMSADELLALKIIDEIKNGKLYREDKYTITLLSQQLSIPEHKLRRIINQHLQFRNFNQFLNKFRVEEAAESLTNASSPIALIAYEVGFATLSAFNRAFKDRYSMTPKDFRKKHNVSV